MQEYSYASYHEIEHNNNEVELNGREIRTRRVHEMVLSGELENRVPCGRWYKWFSLVSFKFYSDTKNMYQIQYGSVVKHIHSSIKQLGFKPQLHFSLAL